MSETSVLDLSEPISLTETLVDIPSPSHQETAIADAVEAALRTVSDIEVIRHQNNVLARTRRGLDSRVILPATWTPCRQLTTCPRPVVTMSRDGTPSSGAAPST